MEKILDSFVGAVKTVNIALIWPGFSGSLSSFGHIKSVIIVACLEDVGDGILTKANDAKTSSVDKKQSRQQRLSEALRKNLARRKSQERARKARAAGADEARDGEKKDDTEAALDLDQTNEENGSTAA